MRNVTDVAQTRKKSIHPAAKAYAESVQKQAPKETLVEGKKEEAPVRFKVMSYALLGDSFFNI